MSVAKTGKNRLLKHHRRQPLYYSMVELMLAMVIVFIALTSIAAMMSFGLGSNNLSRGLSHTTDAAEEFTNIYIMNFNNDWGWFDSVPSEKTAADDLTAIWSVNPIFDNNNVRISFSANDVNDTFDPLVHQSGVFRLEQLNQGAVDFTAVVRIWRDLEELYSKTGNFLLHTEISTPAAIPYSQRKKKNYTTRIYKPPVDAYIPAESYAVARTDHRGFTTEITSVVTDGSGKKVTLTVTSTDVYAPLSKYVVSAVLADTYNVSNSKSWPHAFCTDPETGITGFEIYNADLGAGGAVESFTIEFSVTTADVADMTTASKTDDYGYATVDFSTAEFQQVFDGIHWDHDDNYFKYALVSLDDVEMYDIDTLVITAGVQAWDDIIFSISAANSVMTVTGDLEAVDNITFPGPHHAGDTVTGDIRAEGSISGTGAITHTGIEEVVADIGELSLFTLPVPGGPEDTNYAQPITTISGNHTINGDYFLDGTLYVTGDLTISYSQNITGSGAIVAGGKITIENVNNAFVGANPESLFLYSLTKEFKLSNCDGVTINAVLYSPASSNNFYFNNVGSCTINGGIYAGQDIYPSNVTALSIDSGYSFKKVIPPGIVDQIISAAP